MGANLIDFRPPHQIMTWVGLERYGYLEEAQRLAYRWLYMCVSRYRTVVTYETTLSRSG